MTLSERRDIEDALTRLWPRIQVQTPEEGAAMAVLRAVYPSLPVPGDAVDTIGWCTGLPSPEDVTAHAQAAAVHDDGAQWLCTDRTFPGVTVIRLKVLDGRVMLQNGHSFWQALDECRWAPKARFRPVDVEGCAMPRPPATRGGRAPVRPTCPKCKASSCVAPGRCDDPEHFFGGIGP